MDWFRNVTNGRRYFGLFQPVLVRFGEFLKLLLERLWTTCSWRWKRGKHYICCTDWTNKWGLPGGGPLDLKPTGQVSSYWSDVASSLTEHKSFTFWAREPQMTTKDSKRFFIPVNLNSSKIFLKIVPASICQIYLNNFMADSMSRGQINFLLTALYVLRRLDIKSIQSLLARL